MAGAIKLQPANVHLYVQSGNVHKDASAFTGAITLYDHALRLVSKGPDAEAAHEGKGDALASLGQTKAAIAEYRAASRLISKSDDISRSRLKGKIKALQTAQS